MPPKISVVIPTYNNAALLHETLDGVRRQTWKNFEIIVVDDGSTDDTAEVVRKYDPSICYAFETNQGPAAARNRGVALAQGEFIAFCDHDDVWNDRHLESLLDVFTAYPAAAMVFDDVRYYGEGITRETTHIDAKVLRSMVGRAVPIRRLWQCWVASMSAVMVRKSVFEELGGLHEGIRALDDLHFYLRLGIRYEVRFADYVGCRKRLRGNNLLRQAVVRAIGPFQVRTRLARRYRKLALRQMKNSRRDLARATFLKAYKENFLNLRDLWSYFSRGRGGGSRLLQSMISAIIQRAIG